MNLSAVECGNDERRERVVSPPSRVGLKFPEMKGSCGPQGVDLLVWSVSESVGCEDEITFNKSALRRPSARLPAGRRRAAARALAIFEQSAQRIGIPRFR
jgi:hypothetical protein